MRGGDPWKAVEITNWARCSKPASALLAAGALSLSTFIQNFAHLARQRGAGEVENWGRSALFLKTTLNVLAPGKSLGKEDDA
jgi:hypothetical protein